MLAWEDLETVDCVGVSFVFEGVGRASPFGEVEPGSASQSSKPAQKSNFLGPLGCRLIGGKAFFPLIFRGARAEYADEA